MSTHAPDFSNPFAMAGPSQPATARPQPRASRRGLGVVLVFLPTKRSIDELRSQIEAKRQLVAQGSGLASMLEFQSGELRRATAYEADWREKFPPIATRSAMEGKLHALAEAAGVTTTRFDPEPIVPHETMSRVPISIGCNGTFAQVGAFLHSLESLPVLIWVNSANLEKTDATKGLIACDISLALFVDNPGNSDYAKDSE